MIDWLTITSWTTEPIQRLSKELVAIADQHKEEIAPWKWKQYEGHIVSCPLGSIFVGTGYQKQGWHGIVRISGELADELWSLVANMVKEQPIRITRLDVQMTVTEPDGWSQWRLFNRCKDAGHSMRWEDSVDRNCGELATVYIGSRYSQRMTRVYEKPTKEGAKLLRFETEYKADRAHANARSLARGKATLSQYLKHEMQKVVGDEQLAAIYANQLEGIKPHTERIRVKTGDDKTRAWLLHDVLPVFTRIINSHGEGQEIIDAYRAACDAASGL